MDKPYLTCQEGFINPRYQQEKHMQEISAFLQDPTHLPMAWQGGHPPPSQHTAHSNPQKRIYVQKDDSKLLKHLKSYGIKETKWPYYLEDQNFSTPMETPDMFATPAETLKTKTPKAA